MLIYFYLTFFYSLFLIVLSSFDEKILKEIIKLKDDLIKELYTDNLSLHKELSKQSKIIDEAEKYQKEREEILADNEELHNTVKTLEHEYKLKNNNLDFDFRNRKRMGFRVIII